MDRPGRSGAGSLAAGSTPRASARLAPWPREIGRFVRRKPLGGFAAALVVLVFVCGLFADLIAPHRYDQFDISQRLWGMSWQYPFGTDEQGRDVFSRVIYGARSSILVGFGAIAVSTVAAVGIGGVSGYYGGWFDMLAQRAVDVWLSFPGLIFVILVVSILSHSTLTLIFTIGSMLAAGASRIIRGAVMAIKGMPWIEASRAIGAGDLRILLVNLLPNLVPIIIVNASIQIGAVILLETTLSFLGFGPPPPFPSWGRMLQESQTQMQYHPNLAVFPGLAITLTVYAFNMFGDALRDLLDPYLRGRS
jgi:peptide/nickel transport system permease protein